MKKIIQTAIDMPKSFSYAQLFMKEHYLRTGTSVIVIALSIFVVFAASAEACQENNQNQIQVTPAPPLTNDGNITTTSLQNQVLIIVTPTPLITLTPAPQVIAVDQTAVVAVKNPEINTGSIVNNISQQNTVLIGPQPTPTPVPTPTPAPEHKPAVKINDLVQFSITDDRDLIRAGEELDYRIVIRNFHREDIVIDRLQVHISEFLVPSRVTPGATENPATRTIEWHNFLVSADAEVTYTIRVHVDPLTPSETSLLTSADLNGNGVRKGDTDETIVKGFPLVSAPTQEILVANPPAGIITPAAAVSVSVTATTGPAEVTFSLSSLASIIGAVGLRRIYRSGKIGLTP